MRPTFMRQMRMLVILAIFMAVLTGVMFSAASKMKPMHQKSSIEKVEVLNGKEKAN